MKRQTIIAGIVTILSIMVLPVQKADAFEPAVILTFEMQNSGVDTSSKVRIR